MTTTTENVDAEKKRYSLSLPAPLYNELSRVADEEGLSVIEVLRRFIRLGLYVQNLKKSPDDALCIMRNGTVERLVVL